MKRLLNLFVSVAAAAMAFASCEMVVEDSVPQDEYVYTFTLGSADETKAIIGENSVVWEEGDQMGVYTISTSGTSYNRYGDITPGTPATMEISSYYALSAGDMVYAYYPYTSNNSKEATTVSMSIPTSQDGKDDMPMVSLPIAMASDLAEKTDMNLPAGELKFVNLGAVIEFNVYSTTAEYQSDKIQSVSFVADQAIAGSFTYDLSKVNYSDPATLTISGYEETTVVYTPSTPAPVPAEKASATKIRMVVAPGSYTGEVVVTTDKATYTYNISESKEFGRSAIKPLGLNLREDVRVENPVDDEDLVIATGNLTSGSTDVLLEAGKAIMYSDIKGTSEYYTAYTPGRFYKDNIFTVKSYAGNIKEISITCESGYADDLSNSVSSLGSVTTSGNTVTLSLTTPSTTVTWTNSAQWRASTMSVTYVSSGEIAQMPRNLAFSASTANATVGQDFTEPTLTGNKTDDVTYSSSDTDVATVDAKSGNVTLVAAGTATITATALATSEFKDDEVSYTLTVSEASQGGGDEDEDVSIGETYTATFFGQNITMGQSFTINGMSWTVTSEGGSAINAGDSTKGKQFGTKSTPCTKLVFTGKNYDGGINSIKVTSQCASNTGPVISSVTVGGVEMVSPDDVALAKGTNKEFEFTSPSLLTGDLVITWTSSAKAGIYVSSIVIN